MDTPLTQTGSTKSRADDIVARFLLQRCVVLTTIGRMYETTECSTPTEKYEIRMRRRKRRLTNPQSCCNPCNKQAIVRARTLPGTPKSPVQLSSISVYQLIFLAGLRLDLSLFASSSSLTSFSIAFNTGFTIFLDSPTLP